MRDQQAGSTLAAERPPIERATADDMMQLASDNGPVPWHVGAILVLDPGPEISPAALKAVVADRITAVPRLRQVLTRPPIGCGRPVWVDDRRFDVGAHVRTMACAPPGDETALLKTAVAIAAEPLDFSRPLWSASFVTGVTRSRIALVVVFHHVLADGIGGLAVLANLVDGAPTPPPATFPKPAPSPGQLALDNLRARWAGVSHPAAALRTLRHAAAELHPASASRLPRTSLNQPTGAQRRLTVARADLARIHEVARAHGATVNDVVLTAVTGAVHGLLLHRGETAESLVVSVAVSGRATTTAAQLGNRVGVIPVNLPLGGDHWERLARIAAITRAQKSANRAASAAVIGPAFRALAALGLFRWFINRQRFVNTFLTNLRGPAQQLSFAGGAVADILPLTGISGNVSVSFAILSYAGTLVVTIVADPARNPDLDILTDLLRQELITLAAVDGARQPPTARA
ncbi:MAG TPA: wax ester/triacylglycerol synthase family O-acyltransferase [Streptosporangiaceae bacterium]